MRGIGRLKNLARATIGAHRRSAVMRALHDVTSFVESAYLNEGTGFKSNGEAALLLKLRSADFRIAFDVGANFGDWSAEATSLWPNCQVHAFEVAPETFQWLSERFRKDRNRVVMNCFGLSDQQGTREMYYFPKHPELTCDLPRHCSYLAVPFDAQLDTGDEYCARHNIDTVDFLKVDVKGAEFRVMNGFSKRLSAQKIQCVQFEYGAF